MNRVIVRLAVLALFLAALPMAAQSGAWTAVGSSGDIDEASLGLFAVNGPALQHAGAATGTIVARYNVTNTFGGGFTDAPPWTVLEMTYFDNSVQSNIGAVLLQVDRCTGAVTPLCSLGSFDAAANTCTFCGFPAGSINFATSMYFVEIRLFRSVAAVTPQVIGFRIF
ncbi:MAG TPA: hypothetical protein VF756_28580 [Thermoanaerobaculia bacterium]